MASSSFGSIAGQDGRDGDAGPQADAGSDEQILHGFDHEVDFGPHLGMTRRQRFLRAVKLNLKPDPAILDALNRREVEEMYTDRMQRNGTLLIRSTCKNNCFEWPQCDCHVN